MQIDALGYVGIHTADLEQWATYGTRFLGMQLVGQEPRHARTTHGRP